MTDQPQINVLADFNAEATKEAQELAALDTANQQAIANLTTQLAAEQARAKYIALQKQNLATLQADLAALQSSLAPTTTG